MTIRKAKIPTTKEKEEKKKGSRVFFQCFCEYKRVHGKVCSLFCGQRQVNFALALSLEVADIP